MLSSSVTPLDQRPTRLYYLDWLRVLAVLGVFLFHAVHPFDLTDWHIKNAEQSAVITAILVFMFPWGMPFFFLLAGAGSWFALRQRTAGAFARERFTRLLLPFIAGALSLMPVMLYFEWRHKLQTGELTGTFVEFVLNRNVGFTPIWFGALGYHLWFLGFLFSFSILCLPLLVWFKGATGQRLTTRLGRFCERRGALLLVFIPLASVRLTLQPFFPQEHNWADFFVQMAFFLLGYLLFSQPAFLNAVRRDGWIYLGVGVLAALVGMTMAALIETIDIQAPPRTPLDSLFWILVSLDSWCWTLVCLGLGMRYLDYTNRYLDYGREALLPFFVFHQPVIIVLAYYAVQWPVSLVIKLLFVVIGAFGLTLSLYEFVIRRLALLRLIFGMKPARLTPAPDSAPASVNDWRPAP